MPESDPNLVERVRDFLRLTVHHRGEAEDAYDDAALGYDLFAAVWDSTVGAPALQRLEELLIERTPRGGSVLDVAAGTGRRTELVLRVTDAARVVALDGSAGMLEEARRKITDPRVEFVKASALELPFPDDTFDVVCSTWLLSILDEPREAVSEFLRVLKPGGTALYTFCSRPSSPAGDLADWLAQHVYPDHNPLTHMVAPGEQPTHDCDYALLERFSAGFTSVAALGKCCQVQEEGLPCTLELPA